MQTRSLLVAALCLPALAGCGGGGGGNINSNTSSQSNVVQQVKLPRIVGASYTLTPIPPVAGDYNVDYIASNGPINVLNNSGQVIGYSAPFGGDPKRPKPRDTAASGSPHFFIVQNGVQYVFSPALSLEFFPQAINSAGTIVGMTGLGAPLLLQNNRLLPIGGLPSEPATILPAINNNNQVLDGIWNGTTGGPYLWTNGKATLLPPLPGQVAIVLDLNDAGVVAGYSNGIVNTPVLWQSGVLTPLPILPAGPSPNLGGIAAAINNQGQVVGQSLAQSGPSQFVPHAVLWQNGRITDLQQLLKGATISNAFSINNRGQIVGDYAGPNIRSSFLYSNGVMTDLNTLLPQGSGWTITSARKINDRGEILVEGNQGWALLSPNGL